MGIYRIGLKLTLAGTASGLALAAVTPAWSQSTGASNTLEEVVVTAQRRTERLQDVPVSVAVVSGETLERSNVRSMLDFSNRQPNLQIAQIPSGDQLLIRGTGSGTNIGFEQSVGTFVDGVYRSRARSSRVAFFDIERVEVLKGPQTTFFGANAIAGALNITTRKPTDTFQGNAAASYAFEDGEYNVEGAVGGPVAEGVNLRLAARVNGMDGYIHNTTTGEDGPHNNDGQFRLSGNFQPTEKLTIDARFDYARMRDTTTEGFGELVGCPPAVGSPAANCANSLAQFGGKLDDKVNYSSSSPPSFFNLDLYELAITGKLDLGGASLVSTTGYFQQEYDGQASVPFPGRDALGTSARYGSLAEEYDQFSQELRVQSENDSALQYIAGVYYEKTNLSPQFVSATNSRALGALPALAAVGYTATDALGYVRTAKQESRTLSAFGSLTYKVTDKLNVTGSLRYSDVQKDATNYTVTYGRVLPNTSTVVAGTAAQQAAIATQFSAVAPAARIFPFNQRTDSAMMPSANAQYKFTPDVMAYASYARGFKAGGFSGTSNATFNPEYVDSYEVGLKSQLFGRRLQANISVFRSEYTDMQVSQNIAQPNGQPSLSLITNAAAARSEGVELSLIGRPTSRLTVSSELAYLNAYFKDYTGAACYAVQTAAQGCTVIGANNSRAQSLSGRTTPLAPRWSGNVDVNYVMPLTGTLDLTLGGTAYFKSAYFISASLNPISRQQAYAKLDLRMTVTGAEGRWSAGLIVRNVFDELTYLTAEDLPGNAGAYGIIPDRPRSIAITTNYRF